MSSRIIPAYSHDINPAIDRSCRNCAHWGANADNQGVHIKIKGSAGHVYMQECCAARTGEDEAPEAPVQSYFGAAIFTDEEAVCAAFCASQEALAETAEMDAYYADLDRQLTRDAWM